MPIFVAILVIPITFTIDQLANKSQYIFCKTGLSQCARSPKVPQSPLSFTLRLYHSYIYTSAPVQSEFMPSVVQRVPQITWQSEDDIYRGLQLAYNTHI